MSARVSASCTFFIFLVAGCASVPPDNGFEDARKLLADRGVERVHWNQGTAADAQVQAAVAEMLGSQLTADAAVQIALLNNRNLQATYEDLSVAQADLVQAGLLKNPAFDVALRFHEAGGGTGFEGSIVQDFIDLFQIPLRKRIAQSQFQAAKLRVAGAVLDLAAQTREAFFTLQAGQQLLEMRQSVLDASHASYEVARRLREAGNITELELAMERGQWEQAKLDFAASEADVQADREQLSALMGLWGTGSEWNVATRLPDPPDQEIAFDALENRAVGRSLDLEIYRQQILSAGQRLASIRPFALFPEAQAGVSAEHDAEGGWGVGPALSGPIPIFDQGQARIASAQAELRRARQLYEARAVDLRAEARAAAIHLRSARSQAEYYARVIMPLRQQIVEQTQLQYNAMQVGPFQLLQAKRDQIDAAQEYINRLKRYWLARNRAELIAGGRGGSAIGQTQSEISGDAGAGVIRSGQGGH